MQDYIILKRDLMERKITLDFEDFFVNVVDCAEVEVSEFATIVDIDIELTSRNRRKIDAENVRATLTIIYEWRIEECRAWKISVTDYMDCTYNIDAMYELLESNIADARCFRVKFL